ncbi:MAG: ribosomal protein S18-alanine N-acetyltransferase [Lachnospiraceae bacterium]|nr:ribosomal protein S18-alanine N-acetyltransferase [Lachnospiraceae bacterium]
MEVRSMTHSDVAQVVAIERQIFSRPWKTDDFEDAIMKDVNIYLVALKEDELVGYVGLWGVAGEGQITNVAVSPQHRQEGIGALLMKEVEAKAKEMGIEEMTLEVRKSNLAAIRLYEKQGFVSEGIRPDFYVEPVEDAIIMWKRKK